MKKYFKIIMLIVVVVVITSVIGMVVVHGKNSEQTHPLPTLATLGSISADDGNRPLIEGAATTAPLATIPSVNSESVPILVYHSFGPQILKRESAMQSHYRVTVSAFDAQMKYLADNGYTPIAFNTYINYLKNGTPIPAKSVVLTFDDGWKTQYTYALPILQKYHFVGTFFIISSYPDGNYPAYMSWDQIIALDHDGMEIGSHTVHHINLTKTTPAQLISEITISKKVLESKLGHPITTFAYPEYGQNMAAQTALVNAGYIGARAGWAHFKNSSAHLFEITSQEVVNNPNPFSGTRLPDSQTQ